MVLLSRAPPQVSQRPRLGRLPRQTWSHKSVERSLRPATTGITVSGSTGSGSSDPHAAALPISSLPLRLMFLLLVVVVNQQCMCLSHQSHNQNSQQGDSSGSISSSSGSISSSSGDSQLLQAQQRHRHKALVALEPEPGSIFGSLLGSSTSSSPGNSAAQSQQTAQQSAADLHQSYKNGQTSDKVTLPGDILLGGLFPIHMKGTKVECGEINRDRGIQRLEAMLYALDRINEDSKLLPEIKLGAILLDSCSSSTYALNQSLEFIRASINTVESSAFECKDKSTPRPKYGSKMIAGVIGGSYSEVSLQVANLLRLFRIPQVSYASTGTALSDKTLYDLFARTVPSDMFQARAIADIVLKLNWSYVSLVSSEGLYGDSGSKEFMKQASVRQICIATHEKISPTTDDNAYDIIVSNLLKRNATGVVLFTRAEDTRELLLAVKRARLFNNFAWVAADGWGTHQKLVEGVEEVAWGAITVELQAKAIPGFDQYMKALTPWANGRNPWFSEYWQEWFDCQLQANLVQQQQVASGAYSRREIASSSSLGDQNSWSLSDGGNTDFESSSDYELRVRRRSVQEEASRVVSGSTLVNNTECSASNKTNLSSSSSSSSNSGRCSSLNNAKFTATAGNTVSGNISTRTSKASDAHKSSIAATEVKANSNSGKKEQAQGQRRKRSVNAAAAASMQQLPNLKQFCSPNLRISESNGYRQEQKVQFVVDAVYAMAHALHKAWFNLCGAQPGVVCEALKELNGGDFYSKYLLNVSFEDLAGSEVKFDERGDGLGRYNIYNFRQVRPQLSMTGRQALYRALSGQEVSSASLTALAATAAGASSSFGTNESVALGEISLADSSASMSNPATIDQLPQDDESAQLAAAAQNNNNNNNLAPNSLVERIYTSNVEFEYSSIGRWTENDYNIQMDDIQFIQGNRLIPESYCSRPCDVGQAKIMRAGDHCCWICKTCASYEYLPDEFSCRDCGIGRWPMPNKTSCYNLPQKYLRWDSIYSLISLTIACLGIALTLFVSIIFIKYLDTPVVKASGRELSFILLAGIAFCHLATFVLLSKPTTFICGGQRFLVNFGFALMYASLLVKTNRISRIFNCARKSAKRPSFISPKSQMLITGILVAIQIFLTIVWFVFEPPGIRADSPEGKRDEVILKCRVKGKSFIISLIYNMILITTCTVYAVKTRKIPENFNESKFIGFTMYTTIVIWLAFVTMFFGTNNSYEIQINTMCVCISLSAYVTLFCLFSPKLSIILLHPDKNVRKLTMNSATYKRPFKPVSSLASIDGRYNTTGATYNGAQNDGGSGGPMSTTSNVLNLAESQAARLQESSIVSNVVNSNSGGSNCSNSQKTPTTLSQQLTLVGACANCGAHQLSQMPAVSAAAAAAAAAANVNTGPSLSASGVGIGHHHNHLSQPTGGGSRANELAASKGGGGGTSARLVQMNASLSSAQIGSVGQRYRPTTSSTLATLDGSFLSQRQAGATGAGNKALSRSTILVSSAAAANSSGGGHANKQAAKVLHSKIPPTAVTLLHRSECSVKRMCSDDHLLDHHPRHQHHQQYRQQQQPDSCNKKLSSATVAATAAAVATGGTSSSSGSDNNNHSSGNKKHVASLSRLNEMNSATSSDRHCIDESISSLANDSFINTSQENTPCNVGGHLHGGQQQHYISGKGSDSMLWNQSVYSIDYCSDCCPSYCHCSCPACSSSNGGDEPIDGGGAGSACTHSATVCAGDGDHHQHAMGADTELDEYDAMCDSLPIQDGEVAGACPGNGGQAMRRATDSCEQHSGGGGQMVSVGSVRRRKSEDPACFGAATSGIGTASNRQGVTGQSVQLQNVQSTKRAAAYYCFEQANQTPAECATGVSQLQQLDQRCRDDDGVSALAAGRGLAHSKTTRRSQTMEMRTIHGGSCDHPSASSPFNSSSKLRLLQSQPAASDEYATSKSATPTKQHQQRTATNTTPIAYALQAAANSALGACTMSQVAVASTANNSSSSGQQQQQHYIQFTSCKDKISSERAPVVSSVGGSSSKKLGDNLEPTASTAAVAVAVALSPGSGMPQRTVQRQTSMGDTGQQQQQQAKHQQAPTEQSVPLPGAIQASIELVRSTNQRHKSTDARRQRESSCFGYHDDYEYNYGLVQSNSDSENNYYYYDDDSADGDTAASSIPRDDADDSTAIRLAGDDGDDDDDDNDDDVGVGGDDDDANVDHDDFEHDGRLNLSSVGRHQRPEVEGSTGGHHSARSSTKTRTSLGSGSETGGGSTKQRSGAAREQPQQQQPLHLDEHRINSVALITATLSAGGAIVESGGSGTTIVTANSPRAHSGDPAHQQQQVYHQQQPSSSALGQQQQQAASSSTTTTAATSVTTIDEKGAEHVGCLTTL